MLCWSIISLPIIYNTRSMVVTFVDSRQKFILFGRVCAFVLHFLEKVQFLDLPLDVHEIPCKLHVGELLV